MSAPDAFISIEINSVEREIRQLESRLQAEKANMEYYETLHSPLQTSLTANSARMSALNCIRP